MLVIPMDYGVLCLSFASYGVFPLFLTVYTLIFAATAGVPGPGVGEVVP